MSAIHAFKCDSCKKQVDAKYNGCHYLPPHGWVDIMDSIKVEVIAHMCELCYLTALSLPLATTPTGKKINKDVFHGPSTKR